MKKICFVLILLFVIRIVYGQVETRYFPDSTKLSKINSVSNLTTTLIILSELHIQSKIFKQITTFFKEYKFASNLIQYYN